MKTPILSIIIPMYNASSTIENCLDSLLVQPNHNQIEIIVIDDCSKDNSVFLIKSKYSDRVVLLENNENRGPSFSRNRGIKVAKGKFISFVDADDYVSNDYLDVLIHLAEEDTDIFFFDFCQKRKVKEMFPTTRKGQLLFLFKYNLFGFTWNKIIKKSIILNNDIYFDENQNICEDQLFFYQYICKCKKMQFTKKQLYYYVQHEGSLTNRKFSFNVLLKIYLQKKNFFIEEGLMNEKKGKQIFSNYCLEMILKMNTKNSIVYQDLNKIKKYLCLKNKIRYFLKVQLRLR